MPKIEYPFLYYRLSENAFLGTLVGNYTEAIAASPQELKTIFTKKILDAEKDGVYFAGVKFISQSLKPFRIAIRPIYTTEYNFYPLREVQDLTLYALVGYQDDGTIGVHVPLLNFDFECADEAALPEVLNYVVWGELRNTIPDYIFQLKYSEPPGLDCIILPSPERPRKTRRKYDSQENLIVLNHYGEKMPTRLPPGFTQNAFSSDIAWGMDDMLKSIAGHLQAADGNLLVVGGPGSGKSTVILAAIRHLTKGGVEEQEEKQTFWRVRAQQIATGGKYFGDWQQTCSDMVKELERAKGILWITDTAQMLVSGGKSPQESMAAFMQSYLFEGRFRMIGEVSPEELFILQRKLPAFVELFHVIYMPELPESKVQPILEQYAAAVQQKQKIVIVPTALRLAYRILNRYYPYEQFPGKGIRLLSKCVNQAITGELQTVTPELVISSFVEATGFPEVFLRDDLPLDAGQLQQFFHERIKGQNPAVDRLCQVVKVFKTGLNNPKKPIAVLLFAGPTGVGKTAAAKALAEYFFGHGKTQTPLVRLDMSEFQTTAHLSRLIGNGDEPGQLVRDIRERPFSVLLLDEIEKADDTIFDALLSTLDEGKLTNSFGRSTDFRNCIIIMTTNLGADGVPSVGFNLTQDPYENTRKAVNKRFRPEFINRIDDTVVFTALEKPHIREIAVRELAIFSQREGLAERNIKLIFSDNIVNQLAEIGFDPVYGARPLQRTLERLVAAPTAAWLLGHPKLRDVSLELDFEEALTVRVLDDKKTNTV